jgi:hypothetical protein
MKKIEAHFQVTSWETQVIHEQDGIKLTHEIAELTYTGILAGTSKVHYLMAYGKEKQTSFVGLEQFTGSVEGRTGSFAMEHKGTDNGSGTKYKAMILTATATGALVGLEGHGEIELKGHAEQYPILFYYQLPG